MEHKIFKYVLKLESDGKKRQTGKIRNQAEYGGNTVFYKKSLWV